MTNNKTKTSKKAIVDMVCSKVTQYGCMKFSYTV